MSARSFGSQDVEERPVDLLYTSGTASAVLAFGQFIRLLQEQGPNIDSHERCPPAIDIDATIR